MKELIRFWKRESARIASIVMALAAGGFIEGSIGKAIGIVVPLVFGQAVRETVFAPETVKEKVELAATAVAGQLTATTAGGANQVTPAAQAVVDGVVSGVLGNGNPQG